MKLALLEALPHRPAGLGGIGVNQELRLQHPQGFQQDQRYLSISGTDVQKCYLQEAREERKKHYREGSLGWIIGFPWEIEFTRQFG